MDSTQQIFGEKRCYSRYYQRSQVDLFYLLSETLHTVVFHEKPTDEDGNLLFKRPEKKYDKSLVTSWNHDKSALVEPCYYEYSVFYHLTDVIDKSKPKQFEFGSFEIELFAESIEKARTAYVRVMDIRAKTWSKSESRGTFRAQTSLSGDSCFSYLVNKFRIWLHVPRNIMKRKEIFNEYEKRKNKYKEELKWKMIQFPVFALLLDSRFHEKEMTAGVVDVVMSEDLMKMIFAQGNK